MSNIETLDSYKALLIDLLVKANGPLLHGDELRHLLGFESGGAMRSALSREKLQINLMEFPYRQGKFALSEEVATWLFEQRTKNSSDVLFAVEVTKKLSDTQLNNCLQVYGFLLHEEKIMDLLKIDTRRELVSLHKKKSLPFTVFQLDNRRTKMFSLLPDVISYLLTRNELNEV